MRSRVLATSLVLLLGVTALAGCLEAGFGAFDEMAAPSWEAGYRWSYDVAQDGSSKYRENGATAESTVHFDAQVNVTVINTTQPLDGHDVYYVETDQEVGDYFGSFGMSPLGEGGLAAVRQSDMHTIARVYHWDWENGCGAAMFQTTDEPQSLNFPLREGKTWTRAEDGVVLTAEILGQEEVTVPAGTFDAIRVEIKMEIDEDEFDYEYGLRDMYSTQTYWYAPSVLNIVLVESTSGGSFSEGDESATFKTKSVTQLNDYALDAGQELPVPGLRKDTYRYEMPMANMRVVSDTEFPVNIADGPVTANFGVQFDSMGFHESVPMPVEESEHTHEGESVTESNEPQHAHPTTTVSAIQDSPTYDRDRFTLVWTVYTGSEQPLRIVADSLEWTFGDVAYVRVEATLEPVERVEPDSDCAYAVRPSYWQVPASMTADSIWAKSFSINADAGQPYDMNLATIPIGPGAFGMHSEWHIESPPGGIHDDAGPVFIADSGQEYGPADNRDGWFEQYEMVPGPELLVVWRVNGFGVEGTNVPLALGHTGEVHVYVGADPGWY